MKLASHNTLSYLSPRKFYLKPFKFIARCQSKTIEEQYSNYDIRFFDFRVSFNKEDKVVFKHGLFEYKSDKTIDEYLSYLQSQKEPVIVRILLEEFRDNGHEEQFKKLCSRLESTYSKIKFCGGTYKRGKKVYSFKTYKDIKYKELHSSVTDTYSFFDEFFPWIYAKLNNRKNIEQLKDNKDYNYLMLDFVEIQ